MEGSTGSTVLVVVPDPIERSTYGAWLESVGHQVMECPGPSVSGGCVALREGSCQLTKAADVIVLDHRAGREPEIERHYLIHGKPIVAIGPRNEHVLPFGREWVIRLPWPLDRTSLTNAVRYQARNGSVDAVTS